MELIFKIAMLVFALVVLPATWYYSKRTGKLPKNNGAFIEDVEKTQKEYSQIQTRSIISMVAILILLSLLIKLGVI